MSNFEENQTALLVEVFRSYDNYCLVICIEANSSNLAIEAYGSMQVGVRMIVLCIGVEHTILNVDRNVDTR